ncbi:MAG: M23 family metallopeptidase [Myxococcaceae bacterium]|nr:M23 family metallopeptidase [Myxococcaceae bacterium]
MRSLATALAAAALLCGGCKKPPEEEGPTTPPPRDGKLGVRRCAETPGPKNRVLPVLQRPFDNQYPVFYVFDHQTPGEIKPYDSASRAETWCGLTLFGMLEGFDGYAWGLPRKTPVLAAAKGEVVYAGIEEPYHCPLTGQIVRNQLTVRVKHEKLGGIGFITEYSSLGSLTVKVGDSIVAGQRVGLSGDTGCVTEPLLTFKVLRLTGTRTGQPTTVDPYGWDGPGPDPWARHARGTESLYLWQDGEAPTLGGR